MTLVGPADADGRVLEWRAIGLPLGSGLVTAALRCAAKYLLGDYGAWG